MKKAIYLLFLLGLMMTFKNLNAQAPAIVVSPQTQCYSVNGNTAMAYVSTPVPGATSYSWSVQSNTTCPGNVTTFSNGVNAYLSYSCCGTYSILCTAYSNSVMLGTTTKTTVVTCGSSSPVISGNLNICGNQSTTLFASGATSYTWFPGGIVSSSIVVTPTTTTCYTLTGYGCTSLNSTVRCVTVSTSPVLTVSGNMNVCPGFSTTLTASGASSYTWFTGPGTFTGSTIVLTPTATSCYSLAGSNSPGCTGYSSGCVSISNATSNPVISGNFNICSGQSTVLFASGASTYTWFPGGIVSASIVVTPSVTTCYTLAGYSCSSLNTAVRCVTVGAFSPTLSVIGNTAICAGSNAVLTAIGASSYTWYTSQGTFTGSTIVLTPTTSSCYTVTGSNGPGCTSNLTKCLSVSNSTANVMISGNFNICSWQTTVLFASGASTYTWFPGGITSSSIVVTPTATTCYTLMGYNACGGVSTAVRCVTVSYGPSMSISGNHTICAGSAASLTASGASSYTWLTSMGTFTGSTIVLSPTATTCYTLVGSNSTNCTNTRTGCITVTPPANPVISGNFDICSGRTIVLSASGASSYTWFPSGTVSSSIVISPTATTCYTLVGFRCSNIASAVRCVTVRPVSTVSVSGNHTICAGSGATLTASGASSYTWFTSMGTFSGSTIVLSPTATTCYTVEGSTGSNCPGFATECIFVSPGNNPVISGNFNICPGQTTVLFASGASTYTWLPGGIVSTSIVVSPTTTTCYTLAAYSTCGGMSTAVRCVTVSPGTPSPVINGNFNICSGQSTVLFASGASTYTWFPSGTINSSIVVSPTTTTCYTLVGFGCSNIGTAVRCVTVSYGPAMSISGNHTICAGSSASLTASGASSYTWFTSMSTFTGSTLVLSPIATTCYTLVGSNSTNCTNTRTGCITVTQPANPVISGNFNVCSGQSTVLFASGASTYTWFPSGTVSSSIVISPTATTCYTLVGFRCSNIATAVRCVTVGTAPTISVSGNHTICAGSGATLTASGASSYTWDTYTGTFTGSTIVLSPTIINCYTLTGSNGTGCSAYTSGCVTVTPCCLVTISGNTLSCAGSPNVLTASGATNYTWLPTNTTGATLTVSPLSSTCYTVIGSGSNCNATAVKCISVVTGPSITVNGSSAVCAGSSTTLTASGATSYTWLPGNLHGSSVVVTPSAGICYTVVGTNSGCVGLGYKCIQTIPKPTLTTSSPVFCAGTPGLLSASGASSYIWLPYGLTGSSISITPSVSSCYTVTGSNSSGCTNSIVGCYSVIPAPVINVSGSNTVCAGGSTTLTASGALSYTWMPSNITGPHLAVTPSVSTCYTVVGSNSAGCISKAVKCITVQQGAFLNISGANSTCSGLNVNLIAFGASTYTWNNGSNSPFITVTPSASTCYTVTGTTTGGCIGSAVKCISVQTSPSVTISGPGTICAGTSIALHASGASSYIWGNGSTSSSISATPVVTTIYTVTGLNGACSGGASHTVVVNPKPIISVASSASILCAGEPLYLSAVGASSYTWSTGATTPTIVVTPSVSSNYTVTGSSSGCSNTGTVHVLVSACTGIAKASANTEVTVYPNPSTGQVTLQGDGMHDVRYAVYDVIGRELLNGQVTDVKTIDLSGYANGSYIIRLESDHVTTYKKLILEK